MNESDIPVLDAAERKALAADWKRLQEGPPPRDRRAIGWMTMIASIALGIAAPPLMRFAGYDAAQPVKLGIAVTLGLVFLVGLFLGVFAGSGRFAHDLTRAEAAVEWLSANAEHGESEERRKQAVALLYHAYCVDGPTTVSTINFGEARGRLGNALQYVIAAERALKTDLGVYAVFTDDKARLPG